ncbi:Lipopolysaccharide assembly protein A [Arsenophonus endosymbiont of Aleurodicus dispersus]|uniref:LapA family protein n=1 Tax=Arsenophonus endosymbiont of Aleurodicus dispersus TaxID=235559 RepID=UPI000EAFBA61|nr:lipopolysaccharide assembly protein LapA domain-containing protein [Arsenophonus endosymbiont of Aleurodicus dispersus]VAY02440.1 Lipopolysaccharide assembly protein A [Arsenophonus endosymbiont of Aleurodicus dispersus]
MKFFLILLLVIVIFIASVTLGSSNNQIVTFNYLISKGDYPISILLAVLFVVGFLLGWLICGVFYAKALILLSNARRKIKCLESKLVK